MGVQVPPRLPHSTIHYITMTKTEQIIRAFYDAGYRTTHPVEMNETINRILNVYALESDVSVSGNFTTPPKYLVSFKDPVYNYIC